MKQLIVIIAFTTRSLMADNITAIPLTASLSALSWTKISAGVAGIGGIGCMIYTIQNMHTLYTETPCYQSDISFQRFIHTALRREASITYNKNNEEKEYKFTLNDQETIRENYCLTLFGAVSIVIAAATIAIEELASETE